MNKDLRVVWVGMSAFAVAVTVAPAPASAQTSPPPPGAPQIVEMGPPAAPSVPNPPPNTTYVVIVPSDPQPVAPGQPYGMVAPGSTAQPYGLVSEGSLVAEPTREKLPTNLRFFLGFGFAGGEAPHDKAYLSGDLGVELQVWLPAGVAVGGRIGTRGDTTLVSSSRGSLYGELQLSAGGRLGAHASIVFSGGIGYGSVSYDEECLSCAVEEHYGTDAALMFSAGIGLLLDARSIVFSLTPRFETSPGGEGEPTAFLLEFGTGFAID